MAGVLLFNQAAITVWALSYALFFLLALKFLEPGLIGQSVLWLLAGVFLIGVVKPLRCFLFSRHLFKLAKSSIPKISATEREALEAGMVGWEGELFSGTPELDELFRIPNGLLTDEEMSFINGPVNELCRMIDDWDITHNLADLPPEVWEYVKSQGFLGMIIPKEYGGLGFSATAQKTVLSILYGRSITLASTVAVPNSLGPAELLLKYGTSSQKNYYLPRLADGREIPCFALTAPDAGSDAASISDTGIITKRRINGEEVTGILLNWNKRYITLAPVATIIGLAFRLFDPDNVLGKGYDVGISCALIPADTKGVSRGRRHFPLNIVFQNGPTQGRNVFIPLSYLIGGEKMAGSGWRMLMECLSVGRAISLPSSALGGAQAASLASGAYSRIRKQFNQPICKFEGIEEPLSRIAGYTYIIDSALAMTTAAIDQGAKSGIAGAILKYHTTELARKISLDAMDIHGGKGICLGPNNYLGRGYQGAPISITVEGANILTRNLIIFGQGAIRCHPYVFQEMESIQTNNVEAFEEAFWQHVSFFLANFTKSIIFGFADNQFAIKSTPLQQYYRLLRGYSSQLAFLSDFAMMTLGANLKRKESISARLGDVLSNLYLLSGVLHHYHCAGEPEDELPLLHWSCQYLLNQCEQAVKGVICNFPVRWARPILKICLQPLGLRRILPSDNLAHQLAQLLTRPNEVRANLTRYVFQENRENCPVGQLEDVFQKLCHAEPLEKKLSQAVKAGMLQSLSVLEQINEAQEQGILSKEETEYLQEIERLRQKVIAVDDFSDQELMRQKGNNHSKTTRENNLPLEAV
ncbi:acyl-CoA dehydrogenase [Legionella londiniensis]